MPSLIACRPGVYGKFMDRAWTHLPQIGVRHVEIGVPSTDDHESVRRNLNEHGLTASSMHVEFDIQKGDVVDQVRPQFEMMASFSSRIAFVSIHSGELNEMVAWERLRSVGDCAVEYDVTLSLESHPNLVTNGDVAHHTMTQVNHPNICVNFDTANVLYYNHDTDSVKELKKVIEFVASVHLKDSQGVYHEWNFPSLGKGVVNFPQVFEQLGQRGFDGPYTMELEGYPQLNTDDEAAVLAYVSDSVSYLKQIGVMDK